MNSKFVQYTPSYLLLTSGEIARAQYLESQRRIKRGILSKKREKDSDRFVEDLIWGVPKGSKSSPLDCGEVIER